MSNSLQVSPSWLGELCGMGWKENNKVENGTIYLLNDSSWRVKDAILCFWGFCLSSSVLYSFLLSYKSNQWELISTTENTPELPETLQSSIFSHYSSM